MLDAARPYCLRIIGPNCLGIAVPGLGLNANFGLSRPRRGKLAFLSQSGALVTGILDWAEARGIGFSYVVSMGDMADVDIGDLLDFLAADIATSAILLYLETIPAARKFMSAARSAARAKPVIVIKSGRYAESARAAATHTGALAGGDAAVGAAFRRAGLVRVEELEELFAAAETLTDLKPVAGNELLILTNGGGAGVLAVDDLIQSGGKLAPLSEGLIANLDKVLPANWSRANPIDIIGDASPKRYADALDAVLADNQADALLVINCPTALASSSDAAQEVIEAIARAAKAKRLPPILTNWLGEEAAAEARRKFQQAAIPSYASPTDAVKGFFYLVAIHQGAGRADADAAAGERAHAGRRGGGAHHHAHGRGGWAHDADRARGQGGALGLRHPDRSRRGWQPPRKRWKPSPRDCLQQAPALAVKILSKDISHKSDVGGVRLGLRSAQEAVRAAEQMQKRVTELKPKAHIEGFTVQPMVMRPHAQELLMGVYEDRLFGPMILFGAGGTATEIIHDTAVALPPLDVELARDLMEQTRIFKLLEGYRDRPAADLAAIAERLGAAVAARRRLPGDQGARHQSAARRRDRRSSRSTPASASSRARSRRTDPIRGWPSGPTPINGRNGLRPITAIASSSGRSARPTSISRRRSSTKLSPRRHPLPLPRPAQGVLAQDHRPLHPDRLCPRHGLRGSEPGPGGAAGRGAARGRPRLCQRANTPSSCAAISRAAGIGWALMRHLIRYAEKRGAARPASATCSASNQRMLDMCRALGFEIAVDAEDTSIRKVRLRLPAGIKEAARLDAEPAL